MISVEANICERSLSAVVLTISPFATVNVFTNLNHGKKTFNTLIIEQKIPHAIRVFTSN